MATVRFVLHQKFDHMVHDLGFAVVAVIEEQFFFTASAVYAVWKQENKGQDHCSGGNPHSSAAAPAAAHGSLNPAHQQVQQHGDDHQYPGAGENQLQILNTNPLVDDTAQAAAAHKGGKHSGADGIDHCDTDAGKHGGEGQGEFYHQRPVGLAHAHAPGGLFYAGVHLLKSQAGVAHNRQKRVQCDAGDDSGFSGAEEHHDNAQQSQGGDCLEQVHRPQNYGPGLWAGIGKNAQGKPRGDG